MASAVCRVGLSQYPDLITNIYYPKNFFHAAGIEIFFPKHCEDKHMKPFVAIHSFKRKHGLYLIDIGKKKVKLELN